MTVEEAHRALQDLESNKNSSNRIMVAIIGVATLFAIIILIYIRVDQTNSNRRVCERTNILSHNQAFILKKAEETLLAASKDTTKDQTAKDKYVVLAHEYEIRLAKLDIPNCNKDFTYFKS